MSVEPTTIRDALRRLREAARGGAEDAEVDPEVRLAVYDSPLATPRVISLTGGDLKAFIDDLATTTYTHAQARGSRIPFVVIREIVENLIHAYFHNAVISILDDGNTIRIADQGPGIRDKERALLPGFTTASAEMRRYIRGVGSGLPVAREQLAFLGGTLTLEDNLDGGTVVTLTLARPAAPAGPAAGRRPGPAELTSRQKKILLLIGELGAAGPTSIAKELDISHSTAYRELVALESLGFVQHRGSGKRTLTEDGIAQLGAIFTS